MIINSGINRTSTLEVRDKNFQDTRNRVHLYYKVTDESIEPNTVLGVKERDFYVQNKAAVLDEEGVEISPAENKLDELYAAMTSKESFETHVLNLCVAHAEVALKFIEYTQPEDDEAWEGVTAPPIENVIAWEDKIGVFVPVGLQLSYDGQIYRVFQAHTVQNDWTPTSTIGVLFKLVPQAGGNSLPAWQPWPTVDPYGMGAQVSHNGLCWESANASNTWEPGAPGIGANIWFEIECP